MGGGSVERILSHRAGRAKLAPPPTPPTFPASPASPLLSACPSTHHRKNTCYFPTDLAIVWCRMSSAVTDWAPVQKMTSLTMAPKPRLNFLSAHGSIHIRAKLPQSHRNNRRDAPPNDGEIHPPKYSCSRRQTCGFHCDLRSCKQREIILISVGGSMGSLKK